jgi:hypothetical protein
MIGAVTDPPDPGVVESRSGRPGSEWELLSWGEALPDEIDTVSP